MKYKDIIRYLENQKKSHDVVYVKTILDLFELNIDPLKVIIVAGTNGKGTTCATLQTLLVETGKNVGFFSSPHLEKTNERIKFNCLDISDNDFCDVFLKVHEKVHNLDLSHFEYLTIMAAYYFFKYHKSDIDFAIFEVGMGGTLDATNAIPHNISVITKLGLDHEKVLGNTLGEIAENKFGIISDNNVVFHTKFDPEIQKISEQYAKKYSAKFIEAASYSLNVDYSKKYPIFKVSSKFGVFNINLPGNRAAENSILAFTIFNYLIDNSDKLLYATEKVFWPGRMEKVLYKNRDVFLSGDHNPQGIQSLLEILQYYKFSRINFVVGICNDKNYAAILEILLNVPNSNLYLTETPERTLHINDYGEKFINAAKFVSSNPLKSLDCAIKNASDEDLVIVTGSLYLVGFMKSMLKTMNN